MSIWCLLAPLSSGATSFERAFPRLLGASMQIKCQPEDFRVEELTVARPEGQGRYTFYRLSKRGLGTMEAIEAICRRWNLAGRRVHYAGLKDRHASTIQYLTIVGGPLRALNGPSFELEPVGRLEHPYTSQHLRGNRFEVVGSSRVDLQACKLEYSIVSPK